MCWGGLEEDSIELKMGEKISEILNWGESLKKKTKRFGEIEIGRTTELDR